MNTNELPELIAAARAVATIAHHGQFRRDGKTPYITHPEAVAEMVEDRLKPIAWLHDVIEDTTLRYSQLQAVFPSYVVRALVFLSRADEPYDDYMRDLIRSGEESTDAIQVKIADMRHNYSCQPSENSKRKIEKYLPILEARLSELKPGYSPFEDSPEHHESFA